MKELIKLYIIRTKNCILQYISHSTKIIGLYYTCMATHHQDWKAQEFSNLFHINTH